jgi:hypothetical protein
VQVAQRRVAGAEVVDGDPQAGRPQPAQRRDHVRRVRRSRPAGELGAGPVQHELADEEPKKLVFAEDD